MVRTAEVIKRMPFLWKFILVNGLLHLGLGAVYVFLPATMYLVSTRIVILGLIATGVAELVLYRRKHHTLDGSRLPAFLFDLVIGSVLLLLPFYSIVVFPVFIAAGLLVRGVTDLSLLRRGVEVQIGGAASLRKYAWAKMIIGVFTMIYVGVNTADMWFTGINFAVAGIISVIYANRLRQLKFD